MSDQVKEIKAKKEAETGEKQTLGEWLDNHPKSVFATRAIAWAIFAAGLPFAFIAWRYGIFKATGTIQISGWGILAIVIVAVFLFSVMRYIRKGMKPGFLKQCVGGFIKIILPLLLVLLIVHGIKSNIELFEQALGCVIVCEIIAIPLNPFPEWLEKRRIEMKLEEQESMWEVAWDKFFSKKKEEDKGTK